MSSSSLQIIRFLIVGLSNFAISFAVYLLLLKASSGLALSGALSQLGSYLAGIVWSYTWNRVWTFESSAAVGSESARFFILQIALMVSSAGAIGIAVDALKLHATASWLVVMVFITLVNFVAMKRWVFRAK